MKKIILYSTIFLLFFSCETIEGPYLNNENISNNQPSTTTKNVLIEDFTGHLCPNCPDAAKELEAIQNVYGDKIIGMAIHVTKSFARPYSVSQAPKFQYDFRTEWGTYWDNLFGLSLVGLPRGMVNRNGYSNGNHKLGKDEWLNIVQQELEKTANIRIEILPANFSEKNGFIDINTSILNNLTGNYNLIVCLTENGIVNWQKDGSIEKEDYIHNHVLRTVLYEGQLTNSSLLNASEVYSKRINYDLDDLEEYNINYSLNIAQLGNGNSGNWNPNNIFIVAYVYNTVTYEIIQVEENQLIN